MGSSARDSDSGLRRAARVVGRYALHDPIASGGMATVYIGRHVGPVGFARTVAIKQLHPQFSTDPEFVRMFLDEARLVGRIRHPNVVPTLDVVATDGELFLVMDYVHGVSLSRILGTKQLIPLSVVVAMISSALQGLHAAHEAKSEKGVPLDIVHRDVSPQNVLVGKDGVTRVLDFGIAKAAVRLQSTREGELKGKLEYMAPEQLLNEPVGRALDIYAMGVMLWEMVAARPLFRAESKAALLKMILVGDVPDATTTRAENADSATLATLSKLEAVIQCSLSRRPEERFESAQAMAMALESVIPPASSAQVGAWVERVVGRELHAQDELVAEIEGDEARISLRPEVADALAQSVREKSFSDAGPTPPVTHISVLPIQGRQADITTEVAPRSRRPPTNWMGMSAAIIALGVVTTLAVVIGLARRGPAVSVASADTTTAGIVSAPIAVLSASTPVADDDNTARPSPPPTASAAEVAPAPPESEFRSVRPPNAARAHVINKPAPSHQAADPSAACSPPYTYDSSGVKHYKPECPL